MGVLSRSSEVGAGSTAVGLWSVAIRNTGGAAGTVLGQPLAPSESIDFTGYLDSDTDEFVRLPAISYDATGTTFVITTQD